MMFYFHRLLVAAIVTISTISLPLYAGGRSEEDEDYSSRPIMPFKLGFEFQEGGALVPTAGQDFRLQKKIVFSVYEKGTPDKLWHVVFDAADIEFVTRPFTPAERSSLELCTQQIREAVHILTEMPESFRVSDWTARIISQLELSLLLTPVLSEQQVVKSPSWRPIFMPQATIQHPLRYTIPLYFSMFGYDDPRTMMPMVAALPFTDLLLQAHREANSQAINSVYNRYMSDLAGLFFLHALTLVKMTPFEDQTDREQLEELTRFQRASQQVDSKLRLEIMSRRPFSSMWGELRSQISSLLPEYSQLFVHAYRMNDRFRGLFKVFDLFHRTNYAEQFFAEETGRPLKLSHLLNCFDEEFVEVNQTLITDLLDQGIISLTMLRHIKPDLDHSHFADLLKDGARYFQVILDSVEHPSTRYEINPKNPSSLILALTFAHDALSPPWILDVDNSMGAFNAPLTPGELSYGNAIVEVRAIRNIKRWILNRMGIYNEGEEDRFLNEPRDIPNHALLLFDFLYQYGEPRDDEDFRAGLTHALYKAS